MTASAEPRTPDFFIVGHHKCGTTALYEMLRTHPQIYMPELKEPKFLATDMPARTEPAPAGVLPTTLAEYLALFAPAAPHQRAGEASPSYLVSATAAREIARLQPDARIVAILREPAAFVRSLHLQLVQSHVERERDLRAAFAHEQVVRQGRQLLRYSDHVRYVQQLRRYHDLFGREQVLVLIYDDFRADNDGTVRKVLRFLEVDDTVALSAREANPTVAVRSVRLDQMVRAVYTGRGPLARTVRGGARALAPKRARRAAMRTVRHRVVYGTPKPPDERFARELRARFKGEVEALSDYLHRDLVALWGYGDVG